MGEGTNDLPDVVGGRLPAEFEALSSEHRAALAELVESAAQRRADLMDDAIDESLRSLPGVLRGIVRRTLGV